MMKETNNTGLPLACINDDGNFDTPFATFIVKGTYTLVPDGPCVRAPEQRRITGDVRHLDSVGRSLAWSSDLVPFKPNTDFLIHGTFHQPDGVARPEGRAGFAFGPLRKELAIFGPRTVVQPKGKGPGVTPPQPFTRLPLRWEYAVGGLRFPVNPMGMGGNVTTLENGDQVRQMPLIEYPQHLVRSLNDRPPPAGFAPLPPFFLHRRRKLGTRDQQWSLFRAPLPPEDFDPSFYNAAPLDQQAGNYPRGDETITLNNLHPTRPILTTRLPAEVARLAVLRRTGQTLGVETVSMNLDTVVALPDQEQVVLVWRGRCRLRQRGAMNDLLWVWVEMEPLAGPPLSPPVDTRLRQAWEGERAAQVAAKQAQEAAAARKAAAQQAEIDQTMAEIRSMMEKAGVPPALMEIMRTENDPDVLLGHMETYVKDVLDSAAERFPALKAAFEAES